MLKEIESLLVVWTLFSLNLLGPPINLCITGTPCCDSVLYACVSSWSLSLSFSWGKSLFSEVGVSLKTVHELCPCPPLASSSLQPSLKISWTWNTCIQSTTARDLCSWLSAAGHIITLTENCILSPTPCNEALPLFAVYSILNPKSTNICREYV